ncbi:hypothetical protein MAXJ12_08184 [Mesorhizobium alhagi CCNWXJ12-2]|uniref:Uncharacterized protein n=1 Tax=Mesorhizobium alhagi CCNWXJ12-2 TaxID=1107882 RepID=H0HNA6_9HYPH|nr:hypothetical protein MAXJ12_08184 [Mesorhizobium alhagi CCNWXJ12-2]
MVKIRLPGDAKADLESRLVRRKTAIAVANSAKVTSAFR